MPSNVQIPVLTAVSVSRSFYTSDILDIASSYLEGCYDDYYFFQYDTDEFVLLVGDLTEYQGSVSSDSCTVYLIKRVGSSVTRSENLPFNGDQSGTYAGSDGSGAFRGIVSGNTTLSVTDTQYQYFVASAVADSESFVLVQNPDSHLVYGSFDNYPHLIEGVQNYAFAGFILCFGVLVFKLSDRLFRRIY